MEVDALAVVERDERMGDRAAVMADDGQLTDQRHLKKVLDRLG
jgi:hypothetical protein